MDEWRSQPLAVLTPAGCESARVAVAYRRSAVDPDLGERAVKGAILRKHLTKPLRIDLPASARVVRSMKSFTSTAIQVLIVEENNNSVGHQAAKK
jgi:hypothetical protein